MLVRSHHDPRDFLELVEPFLLQREAENGLPLGIARSFVELATHDGMMFSVESGAAVVAVAVKSPKRNLVITAGPDMALQALAKYLHTYAFPVPGANGPEASVREFSAAWCALNGETMTERVRLRLFELHKLAAELPAPPAGAMRFATLDDAELVERWLRAFIDEATHDSPEGVRDVVARRIGAGQAALWIDEHDKPVSMAATVRRSKRGSTIAWVYTPPAARGRGYATACVAALTRSELTSGRSFVTLFTDRSNSTSNAMYGRIGYVPVCDALDVTFH